MARVYLTGGIRIDGPRGTVEDADLPGTQARVAFAALVLERRPLSRDALAEIIWDGRLPNKWEGALSTLVSKLRAQLTRSGLEGKTLLAATDGTYRLALPSEVWVDLEEAYRRLDRAEGALRHRDLVTATAEGTVASGVLRRSFLAGTDINWAEDQRCRQREALYRCWVVLATAWLGRGDYGLATVVAESAIRLDPLREVGHRLLMSAEWRRGDRAAALRAFAGCEHMLRAEFGVGPSPETLALLESIRG